MQVAYDTLEWIIQSQKSPLGLVHSSVSSLNDRPILSQKAILDPSIRTMKDSIKTLREKIAENQKDYWQRVYPQRILGWRPQLTDEGWTSSTSISDIFNCFALNANYNKNRQALMCTLMLDGIPIDKIIALEDEGVDMAGFWTGVSADLYSKLATCEACQHMSPNELVLSLSECRVLHIQMMFADQGSASAMECCPQPLHIRLLKMYFESKGQIDVNLL